MSDELGTSAGGGVVDIRAIRAAITIGGRRHRAIVVGAGPIST
jgi:hypothetical protein